MAETKWTPGPWRPSKFGFQVVTGDSWNSICTLKAGAEWEDRRGAYEQEYEWQNQEANAALIAAAPELYAALEWAEKALAPFSTDPAEKSGIALIRAALAKARGEPS